MNNITYQDIKYLEIQEYLNFNYPQKLYYYNYKGQWKSHPIKESGFLSIEELKLIFLEQQLGKLK